MSKTTQPKERTRHVKLWAVVDPRGRLIGNNDSQLYAYKYKLAAQDAREMYGPAFGIVRCVVEYPSSPPLPAPSTPEIR